MSVKRLYLIGISTALQDQRTSSRSGNYSQFYPNVSFQLLEKDEIDNKKTYVA